MWWSGCPPIATSSTRGSSTSTPPRPVPDRIGHGARVVLTYPFKITVPVEELSNRRRRSLLRRYPGSRWHPHREPQFAVGLCPLIAGPAQWPDGLAFCAALTRSPRPGPRPRAAATPNPKTTWCVTVTDEQCHAVAHGCAQPNPRATPAAGTNPANPARPAALIRPRDQQHPRAGILLAGPRPARPARRIRHLDTADQPTGDRTSIVALDPITTGGCDHRFAAQRHDPGIKLRHLSPDPARHLHQPHLPATRRQLRLRAQHPLRSRRPVVPVQRRPEVPP